MNQASGDRRIRTAIDDLSRRERETLAELRKQAGEVIDLRPESETVNGPAAVEPLYA